MRPARTARFGLLLVALTGWLCAQDAAAETVPKARRSVPARPFRTAPDVTATIGKPSAPVPHPLPLESEDVVPPPFKLPTATRARVRACGEAWRDMKLAGTTLDDDWRDFAMKCLVGKGPAALAD